MEIGYRMLNVLVSSESLAGEPCRLLAGIINYVVPIVRAQIYHRF